MADVGEVYADLVRAACFQPAGEEAGDRFAVEAFVFLQDFPVGYRLAPALPDRLLVARLGMALDRCVDRAFWAVGYSPDEGQIGALQRARPAMVGELGGQFA